MTTRPRRARRRTSPDTRKRRAVRERDDGGKRDPFILNRFEKILAMAEMVNVDRPSDDSEDEDARKAADDLDELAIGRRSGKPATKLKFDLDLPPQALDATRLDSGRLYPEWDYRAGVYLPDHCRVLTGQAPETGESWTPDANIRRHVRQVRRRFEALRPQHEVMLLCSRPGRAAPPVASLTGRASSAQTGLQGRLEHRKVKCYIICCIEYIIMANAIRRKRRTSMDKSELEAMPLDDLWALHERLTALLSKRILAEKRQLENRLVQLNRGKVVQASAAAEVKSATPGYKKNPQATLCGGYPKISKSGRAVGDLVWTWQAAAMACFRFEGRRQD